LGLVVEKKKSLRIVLADFDCLLLAPVYFVDKRVVTGVILSSDRPATDGDVCHTHLYAGEPVPFPFHAVATASLDQRLHDVVQDAEWSGCGNSQLRHVVLITRLGSEPITPHPSWLPEEDEEPHNVF
jgi:hypothetical protein